jgi:hypothetical protein
MHVAGTVQAAKDLRDEMIEGSDTGSPPRASACGYPKLNPAVNGLPSPTVVAAIEGDSDVARPNLRQVSHD